MELRSPVVVVLSWSGGAEPWVIAEVGGSRYRVGPGTRVWEMLLHFKGHDVGRISEIYASGKKPGRRAR